MLIRPSRKSVFLKTLNKNVFLNHITIADEEWFQDNYPEEKMVSIFAEKNITEILNIFWHLLDIEAKKAINSVRIMEFVDGKEVEKDFNDPAAKLKYIVSGSDEMLSIIQALFDTKQMSNPDPVATEKKSPKAAGR